jgi:predicted ATPase
MTVHLKNVSLHPEGYPTREHYPFKLPVFQQTRQVTFDAPVTLFVGENGTGKSTLLEAVAHACGIYIWRTPEGRRCEVNPYEDSLRDHVRVEWAREPVPGAFFGSDIARDFAYLVEEWASDDPGQLKYFGGKSLVTQSHGQSLMSLFRTRYHIKGLYLMDEPETALSPRSQLELLEILEKTTAAGTAQFIIATHSPLLLACPGAVIYSFDRCPVAPIAYEETEHYRIYRSFLVDRGSWLRREGSAER